MAEEPKKVSCPNCLGPAIKEGNKIICETCDAEFTFTKTGGAKVTKLGPIEDHEQRIKKLESLIPGQEPDPAKLDPDPADLEPDPAAQESSLLGPE